jgi:anti-sigma regulatory factor (Ser/Thr protein kinase)
VNTVELEFPPRSVYVGVARLALASLARTAGIDEDVIDDLRIAVSEACANAVIAHDEMGLDDPFEVAWSENSHQVVVEVCDRASSYDVEPGSELDSQGISTRLPMSAALMASLVDECNIRARSDGGSCARLVLNR